MFKTLLRHAPVATILLLAAGCVAPSEQEADPEVSPEELGEATAAVCSPSVYSPQLTTMWNSSPTYAYGTSSGSAYNHPGYSSPPPFPVSIPSCESYTMKVTGISTLSRLNSVYSIPKPSASSAADCTGITIESDAYGRVGSSGGWTYISGTGGTPQALTCTYSSTTSSCTCPTITGKNAHLPNGPGIAFTEVLLDARAKRNGVTIPFQAWYANNP